MSEQAFSTRDMAKVTGLTVNQIGLIVSRVGFPVAPVDPSSRIARRFSFSDVFWMTVMARLARAGVEWVSVPLILEQLGLSGAETAIGSARASAGELFPGETWMKEGRLQPFLAVWHGNPSDGPGPIWDNQPAELQARIATHEDVAGWIAGRRAGGERRSVLDFAAVTLVDLTEARHAVCLGLDLP